MKTREIPLVLALVALVSVVVTFPIHNYDIHWHLANGRQMMLEGRIINEEVFSHTTQGTAFVNKEWLSQIIFWLVDRASGANGLLAFKALCTSGMVVIMYMTARMMGAPPMPSAILIVLAVLAGMPRYTVRPQMFSHLFAALFFFVLYGYGMGRLGRRWLWVLPPVLLVWDFMHGSLYGTIILSAYFAAHLIGRFRGRQLDRSLVIAAGASLLVLALNPYGLVTYAGYFEIALNKAGTFSRNIELMPTYGEGYELFWAYWLMLGGTLALMAVSYRRLSLEHIMVLLPFMYISIQHKLGVAVFAIAALPVAALCVGDVLERAARGGAGLKASRVVVALCGLLLVAHIVNFKFLDRGGYFAFGTGVDNRYLPVQPAEFALAAGLKGKLYNDGHLAGYLAYALYPDSRIFNYNFRKVFDKVQERLYRTNNSLDYYGVDYAIADHTSPTSTINLRPPQWVPLFWDESAAVYIRNNAANSGLISRYGLSYITPGVSMPYVEDVIKSNPSNALAIFGELSGLLSFRDNAPEADYFALLLSRNAGLFTGAQMDALIDGPLRRNPDAPRLVALMGDRLYARRQLDDAARMYEKSLALGLQSAHVLVNLSYIKYDKGDFAEAARGFREAMVLAPESADAYYGLGLASKKSGDTASARKAFEDFLKLNRSEEWRKRALEQLQALK